MDGDNNDGTGNQDNDSMDVTEDNEETDERKKRIVGGNFKVSSTVSTEKKGIPKWFKTAK